jgi:hypothetical protein
VNGLRGFIAGTITVASAEVLLTAPGVAGRIGGFGDFLAVVIDRVVNPDVPALGPANFQAPPPVLFGDSTTTTTGKGKPLKSTKAKPPKAYAPGARRAPGTTT